VFYAVGTEGVPKGGMFQVRNAYSQIWSRWIYQPASGWQPFSSSIPDGNGAFAAIYDLSSFGIPIGGAVDRIRFVNMKHEDKMLNYTSRAGIVLADDDGATSYVTSDAGIYASYVTFGDTTFDPLPLYIGILQYNNNPITTIGPQGFNPLHDPADDEDPVDDDDDIDIIEAALHATVQRRTIKKKKQKVNKHWVYKD